MKASELRKQSTVDLQQELLDLLREQFNLRMQKASGQMSQTHKLGAIKRDIARIYTVINEQKHVGEAS